MNALRASKLGDSFTGEFERIADGEWADTKLDGGWLLLWCDWGNCHIVPVLDQVVHQVAEGDECICGPAIQMMDDGSFMVSHASLDGREQHE